MENYDLIDDYLANRLNEQDRNAFEQGMEGDPGLKSEVEFQQQIVQGVKQARITELKMMLSNVTVSSPYWTGGKVAATVITAGIIATAVYFYGFEQDQQITSNETAQEDKKIQPSGETDETVVPLTSEEKKGDSTTVQQPKEKLNTKKELKKTSPVTKPDLQIVDPSSELNQTEEKNELANPNKTEIGPSKMEVAIAPPDKKHTFHYQFVNGKLLLYGPFDKNLYEILEIHGDGHAVFLFYKENYFLLDEKQSEIAKLEAIRDGELLKKLKQYRGQ